ncbi:MAG: hypothetical protein ABI780_09005, partial [Ardenticatenales bacterium]
MTNAQTVELGDELVRRRLGCHRVARQIRDPFASNRFSVANPSITDRPASAIRAPDFVAHRFPIGLTPAFPPPGSFPDSTAHPPSAQVRRPP